MLMMIVDCSYDRTLVNVTVMSYYFFFFKQMTAYEMLRGLVGSERCIRDRGQYPFGAPFYLLIDMQIEGSWVGKADPKQLPVEMEIDWVKLYELEQEK